MSKTSLEVRAKEWMSQILCGFGWEVERQAMTLSKDFTSEEIENVNHPTAVNSVWQFKKGQGIYFLSSESIYMKFCSVDEDFDDFDGKEFVVDIRCPENGRGAEILFVEQPNETRILTTAELATVFLSCLQDASS